MPRPQRFPRKIEFWTTDEQGDAFALLEGRGLLGRCDHYRQAFDFYLRQIGAASQPRPPRHPNGKQQEQAHAG